jgi:hypothetical protein
MKDYVIEIKDSAKGKIIKALLKELGFVEIRKDIFMDNKSLKEAVPKG